MGNTGWSNEIPNPLLVGNLGIQLLGPDGVTVVGTVDGVKGVVLYGNGNANNPGFQVTPFGDVIWGGDPTLTADQSIEIGSVPLGGVSHPAMILSSGATDAGQNAAVLKLYGASADGTQPGGVVIGDGVLVGNNPSVSGNPPGFPETWHPMSLANGWTANVGFDTPSYRMNGLGAVEFKGLASGGTHTAGTVVTTLPAAWRPSKVRQLVASADGTISPFCCVLHVGTDGTVTIFQGASTASVIGFDGLSFYPT